MDSGFGFDPGVRVHPTTLDNPPAPVPVSLHIVYSGVRHAAGSGALDQRWGRVLDVSQGTQFDSTRSDGRPLSAAAGVLARIIQTRRKYRNTLSANRCLNCRSVRLSASFQTHRYGKNQNLAKFLNKSSIPGKSGHVPPVLRRRTRRSIIHPVPCHPSTFLHYVETLELTFIPV